MRLACCSSRTPSQTSSSCLLPEPEWFSRTFSPALSAEHSKLYSISFWQLLESLSWNYIFSEIPQKLLLVYWLAPLYRYNSRSNVHLLAIRCAPRSLQEPNCEFDCFGVSTSRHRATLFEPILHFVLIILWSYHIINYSTYEYRWLIINVLVLFTSNLAISNYLKLQTVRRQMVQIPSLMILKILTFERVKESARSNEYE